MLNQVYDNMFSDDMADVINDYFSTTKTTDIIHDLINNCAIVLRKETDTRPGISLVLCTYYDGNGTA